MGRFLVTFINPSGFRYSEELIGATAAEAIFKHRSRLHEADPRAIWFDKESKNVLPEVWSIKSL